MKQVVFISILLAAFWSHAQSVTAYVRAEPTIKGVGLETGADYQFGKGLVGGFFINTNTGKSQETLTIFRDTFMGLRLSYPICQTDRISLMANVRAGFVNEQFFVLAPALETRVRVAKRFLVLSGAGYRHGYPSLSGGIGYHLSKPGS